MANLTLMRHSISTANEEGINDSGRFDAPLSDTGEELAFTSAAEVTECPDAIYCSDMRRAHLTADIYARVLEKKFSRKVPVIVIPELKGRDEGLLEGIPFDELQERPFLRRLPDEILEREPEEDVFRRQMSAFAKVAAAAESNNFQNTLIVTHSDAIVRFLMATDNLQQDQFKMPGNCEQVGPFDSKTLTGGPSPGKSTPSAPPPKP